MNFGLLSIKTSVAGTLKGSNSKVIVCVILLDNLAAIEMTKAKVKNNKKTLNLLILIKYFNLFLNLYFMLF
jgi:hypothetical protein